VSGPSAIDSTDLEVAALKTSGIYTQVKVAPLAFGGGPPVGGRGAGGSPPSTWRLTFPINADGQRNRSSQASASQAMLTLVCIRVGFNSVRLKAASIACSRSEILTGFTQCSLTSASRLLRMP
jgi:hypothetical protein